MGWMPFLSNGLSKVGAGALASQEMPLKYACEVDPLRASPMPQALKIS